MKRRFLALGLIFSLILLTGTPATARDTKPNTATDPQPRSDGWWTARHESMNKRVALGNVDLIFIGDSITHSWEGAGKDVWDKYYGKRNAVNLGISGDRTQHVLWRLDHGNIDGIHPKLAVIMIGTNNSNGADNTAEEIGAGITAIVEKLRAKLPETKVLVLAIFPRGEKPGPQREKNAKASEIAARLADNRHVFYLDIGPKFLAPDGTLSKDIMNDFLHPNAKGYEIWAAAIEDKVAELMGEKK
jgi:beta-glucosidase